MNHVIYSRVSTVEQNAEQQSQLLQKAFPQATHVFEDKFSGATLDRPELDKMLGFINDGDTLYVYDVSRLGRNTSDVLALTEKLKARSIKVIVHTLGGVDINSTHGKMILTVLASVATMQREEMLEKQAIGIETAKKLGKYRGKKADPQTAINCQKVYDITEKKELKLDQALKAFGVSRATYYRWKK